MTFSKSSSRLRAAVAVIAAGVLAPALPIAPAGAFVLPPVQIPSATPVVPAQSTADFAQQSMRIDRTEEQMRQLTGRIEELTYQLQQMQQLLKRMQEDTEYRFREIEGGKPQRRSEVAPDIAPSDTQVAGTDPIGDLSGASDAPMDGPDQPLQPGFSIDSADSMGVQPQVLGTIPGGADAAAPPSDSALGGPLDLSAIARGDQGYQTPATVAPSDNLPVAVDQGALAPPPADTGGTQVAAIAVPTDARTAYDQAYGYVVAGDYGLAEMSLKQFIADYPKDKMIPSARFWLGESHYQRKQFREAAENFLAAYRDYPKSQKAPESLLKLGLSLEGLGEREAACATYGELESKFPKAGKQLLAKAAELKSGAGC